MPRRAGFTLVELLVALVVIDVALLAFAADAALLVRLRASSERRDAGLLAATSRLARLRIGGCAAATGGAAAPSPGVHEAWSVAPQSGGALLVHDSVSYGTDRAARALVLDATIEC